MGPIYVAQYWVERQVLVRWNFGILKGRIFSPTDQLSAGQESFPNKLLSVVSNLEGGYNYYFDSKSILMSEAVCSLETLAPLYQSVWCIIIEDQRIRSFPFACLRFELYSYAGETFVRRPVSLKGQALLSWRCPDVTNISKQVRTEAQNGSIRGYPEIGITRIFQFITHFYFHHSRLFRLV